MFCPNCTKLLIDFGAQGIKECESCHAKYFILETTKPTYKINKREIAWQIYESLKEYGAAIGNASVNIIENILS